MCRAEKFFAKNSKKGVDKRKDFAIINIVVRSESRRTRQILRNCVKVARQTLTLFVRVRILLPQPFRGVAQFGRALRSGRRGRWFESSHLDHTCGVHDAHRFFSGNWPASLFARNRGSLERMQARHFATKLKISKRRHAAQKCGACLFCAMETIFPGKPRQTAFCTFIAMTPFHVSEYSYGFFKPS